MIKTLDVSQRKAQTEEIKSKILLSKDGKVILKIRYEDYSNNDLLEESVANSIFNVLSHELDKHNFETISQQTYTSNINLILNSQLTVEFKNFWVT